MTREAFTIASLAFLILAAARAEFFDRTFARRRPRQQLEVIDGHFVAVEFDDVTSGLPVHHREPEIAELL